MDVSARFAQEIASVLRDRDLHIDRLHVYRFPWQATDALRAQGFDFPDADDGLLPARAIKLPIELPYFREAMDRIETAVSRLENKAKPEKTDSEVWAEFYYSLMAKEGHYVSTRPFQGGPNTYPYFQAAGDRPLGLGDLLCFDTDAVAFENHCVDSSRTFLCGDGKTIPDQRLLYGRARDQVERNAALLKPEMEFCELAESAWKVPEEHQKSRYYCVGHGLGMSWEWPNIPHHVTGKPYPLEGVLEPKHDHMPRKLCRLGPIRRRRET